MGLHIVHATFSQMENIRAESIFLQGSSSLLILYNFQYTDEGTFGLDNVSLLVVHGSSVGL